MTTTELEHAVLSGWCSPAALDGLPHPTDHARCQDRLDKGQLPHGCACPDHQKGDTECPGSAQ